MPSTPADPAMARLAARLEELADMARAAVTPIDRDRVRRFATQLAGSVPA